MDNLDRLTLVLLGCLVIVALLLPLTAGRQGDRSERPHDRSD